MHDVGIKLVCDWCGQFDFVKCHSTSNRDKYIEEAGWIPRRGIRIAANGTYGGADFCSKECDREYSNAVSKAVAAFNKTIEDEKKSVAK